jgi:hypothetical protein
MKKYLFILTVFFLSSKLYGQENKVYNNHIGINLASIKFISENYIPNGYKFCLPNGIFFKHDTKNFTYNYFLNFNQFQSSFPDGPITGNDIMYTHNQYSLWTVGFGIQKNIDYEKLRIYYGLDLFNDFSIYKEHIVGGIAGFNNYYNYYHLWLGARPLVGLQYQCTKQIALSVESNFNFACRIKNTDKYISSIKGFQTYFNPLTISLSYNF